MDREHNATGEKEDRAAPSVKPLFRNTKKKFARHLIPPNHQKVNPRAEPPNQEYPSMPSINAFMLGHLLSHSCPEKPFGQSQRQVSTLLPPLRTWKLLMMPPFLHCRLHISQRGPAQRSTRQHPARLVWLGFLQKDMTRAAQHPWT